MYDTILVGVDGSDGSYRAVEFAVDLAGQYGAEVHALDVVNTDRYGEPALSSAELVLDEIEDRATEVLTQVEEIAEAANVGMVTSCCHGTPHEAITDSADEIEADVIVLGYQGRTQSGDQIGSIANRVLNSTDRPVLLA